MPDAAALRDAAILEADGDDDNDKNKETNRNLAEDEIEEDQQGLDADDLPQIDLTQPLNPGQQPQGNPQFNYEWTEKIIEDPKIRICGDETCCRLESESQLLENTHITYIS